MVHKIEMLKIKKIKYCKWYYIYNILWLVYKIRDCKKIIIILTMVDRMKL